MFREDLYKNSYVNYKMCFKIPKILDFKVSTENKKRFVEILLIVMSILVAFSDLGKNKTIQSVSILFITLAIIYYGILISEHKKFKRRSKFFIWGSKFFTFFMSILFSGTLSANIIFSIITSKNYWTFYVVLFWIYYLLLTGVTYKILIAKEK